MINRHCWLFSLLFLSLQEWGFGVAARVREVEEQEHVNTNTNKREGRQKDFVFGNQIRPLFLNLGLIESRGFDGTSLLLKTSSIFLCQVNCLAIFTPRGLGGGVWLVVL